MNKLSGQSQFVAAINTFVDASVALNRVWEETKVGGSNDYPFKESFDELLHRIISWRDTQKSLIGLDSETTEPNESSVYDQFKDIADAFNASGLNTTVESAAGLTSLTVTLPNEKIIMFGDSNATWGGEIYNTWDAYEQSEAADSLDTGLASTNRDPAAVLAAFRNTFLP
ncbi:hypothetical protein [Edaphobacter modestus]|uniref:Uncharacterized protein n=1 Tax=Edaphobacter modestus TaxID=388466 RepID=A0A4Q7XYY7_9BACT|nr:hypothetical protein [Edaphobacter modestus]RZU29001.1 hypothetical protein BDD14_6589 [Edaphobacter modestus]